MSRRPLLLAAGALGGLIVIGVIALALVGRPSQGSTGGGDGSVAIGTAVGQLAPDFRLVDNDGRTVTRDSLRGKPAIVWFTTSYCVPCQEGAKSLQRVLAKIGAEDNVAVVVVFVDPGEPPDALAWWKSRFGRPDWTAAFAAGSMIREYRVQYLDSKYLLDRDGVIRTTDFLPLQEEPWTRDLRAVIGG
jgi:thiol-disulfide isomerase/thioredoxin